MVKAKLLFMVFILSIFNSAQAAIWVDENAWSPAYESQYQDWLKKSAHPKMFSNEKLADGSANPYYGIPADCADLVYTLRLLFAYENKLPFAIANPVSKSGPVVTNLITRYDKTPEGMPRVKKFLAWLHDVVSTNGLPRDTYSIPFKQVGPGTIILTSKKNHHSWTIRDIDRSGNPYLIFNSVVGRESGLQLQERHSWPNPAWIFEAEVDKDDETIKIPIYKPGSYAGFRFWKPIEYLKELEASVPGFSDEQHRVGINKWKSSAQTVLAKVKETPDQIVSRLLKDACADFKQRIDAVHEAETYKTNLANDLAEGKTEENSSYIKELMADPNRPSDLRCMIYKAFDQHSTPSRDKRLIDALILARAYYTFSLKKFGASSFGASNLALYKALFPLPEKSAGEEARLDTGTGKSDYCSAKINNVGTLTLARFKRRMFAARFSSNPNDAPTGRFGYDKTSKDLGAVCPVYDLTQKVYDLNAIEAEMMNEVLSSPIAQ